MWLCPHSTIGTWTPASRRVISLRVAIRTRPSGSTVSQIDVSLSGVPWQNIRPSNSTVSSSEESQHLWWFFNSANAA